VLKQLCLALVLTLGGGGVFALAQEDPEPTSKTKDEAATPAVDPDKAKSDKKLQDQLLRNQAVSTANIKRIGLAVHSYNDIHNHLPADITGKNGKALLSWRVAILPHIGQAKLHKEFKLDEPWDSRHNRKLLDRMPDVFRSPRVKVRAKGNTAYQAFMGREAVLGRGFPMRLANITDGTSNTIWAVEASNTVPWTKPGGIPFDRTKAVPDFGKAFGKMPLAVMLDGTVRVLNLKKIGADTLKNAIDPSDGNVLGADWSN
jgi:hypothetical protein